MNKERELENLTIMRDNGLISEETYQAQRCTLLGKPMVKVKIEQDQKRLQPLSLLNAFKFSFRPAVFGANFVFLFVTVMFALISVIVLFNFLEIVIQSMIFNPSFFDISQRVLSFSLDVLVVFWGSIFVAFFSRLALERLTSHFPPFELKSFIFKSFSFCLLWLAFMVILFLLSQRFAFYISNLELKTLETWKRHTIGGVLLSVYILIVVGLHYVQMAMITACVGSPKHWWQTVVKALKKPLLILFALGCFIVNELELYWVTKKLEVNQKELEEIILDILEPLRHYNLSLWWVYLILAFVLFLIYIRLSARGKFWFKVSFAFLIPSLIILICILSILPIASLLPMSFYFAYFLGMQLFWAVLYCVTFFVVQQMAFFAHILTQVWCHLTHDKAGNYLFASADSVQNKVMPQPHEESEYLPPEVFR